MLPRATGIYLVTNNVNRKVWVGQAVGVSGIWGRYQSHLKKFRAGKNSPHFQAAWDAYGPDAFSWEVLVLCPPEQADAWENHYIAEFKSSDRDHGYNIAESARGAGRCSEETKEKMRRANTGRKATPEALAKMRGREFSPEHKAKLLEANRRRAPAMSALLRGRKLPPLSEERKAAISECHRGRKRPDITRQRISEALKGKSTAALGTVWVTRDGVNRRVSKEQLGQLVGEGWTPGRSKS